MVADGNHGILVAQACVHTLVLRVAAAFVHVAPSCPYCHRVADGQLAYDEGIKRRRRSTGFECAAIEGGTVASDATTIINGAGFYVATIDGDCAARAMTTSSNTCGIVTAPGFDSATVDGEKGAAAILASADTSCPISACGCNSATVDGDVA